MCAFGIMICADSQPIAAELWMVTYCGHHRCVAYCLSFCGHRLRRRCSCRYSCRQARFARPTLQSIRNASIMLALPALTIALIVWPRHHTISQYYISHIAGDEQSLRLARANLTGTIDRLKFYPQSLALDHLGVAFGVVAGGLLLFAWVVHRSAESVRREMFFLIVTMAVIMTILTIDPARSRALSARSCAAGDPGRSAGTLWNICRAVSQAHRRW